MNIRYRVDLSEAERLELDALLSGGRHAARKASRSALNKIEQAKSREARYAKRQHP